MKYLQRYVKTMCLHNRSQLISDILKVEVRKIFRRKCSHNYIDAYKHISHVSNWGKMDMYFMIAFFKDQNICQEKVQKGTQNSSDYFWMLYYHQVILLFLNLFLLICIFFFSFKEYVLIMQQKKIIKFFANIFCHNYDGYD